MVPIRINTLNVNALHEPMVPMRSKKETPLPRAGKDAGAPSRSPARIVYCRPFHGFLSISWKLSVERF